MLPQSILLISLAFSPFICDDAACYGAEGLQTFDKLWGNENTFVADWEEEIKPGINQWMGAGIAVSGVALVIKALVK